jgi:hypothetical protein
VEPEKSPSLWPRIVFWLRDLLHTLVSLFSSVFSFLHRTWRHLKFKKTESTINKPETTTKRQQAQVKESSNPLIGNTTGGDLPASTGQSQAQNSGDERKYAQYVVWPFVAIWKYLIRPVGQFLEGHHASVTSVATVAIVALTFAYVHYSKNQWTVMKGQLEEQESTSRPYVYVIAIMGHPMTADFTDVPVTIGAGNFGNSPAIDAVLSEPVIGLNTDSNIIERLRTCTFTYPENGFRNILPPSQLARGVGVTAHTVTRILAADARRDVINHTKHVFVVGGIKYTGVRGGNYETTYCLMWNPESATDPRNLAWSSGPECPCAKMK